MAEQQLQLEQYVKSVRRAFGAAQANADRHQHIHVTVDHLLAAMLEAGMGEDPCKRAGVEIKSLLGKATAALDALPRNATDLAFLDAELLATMARAEAVAKQLGAPLVDIQCMYVALGARKHLPTMIGLGKWSDTERIGSVPPAAASVTEEPTLSATLNDAAAALAGLGAQVAAACGVPTPPAEVKATFERILLAFDKEWTPFLTLDWRKRGDAPPKDFHQALVATRDGCEGRSVVVTWVPPATMVLETTDENGIQLGKPIDPRVEGEESP
ncbi:MAG: hypothetical protein HOO96_39730 [Polyangiaceae bacterium]|nr:hypothetical protein [Polyangiaceae bacterium]